MISVTILTKNSSRHLREVLEALRSFDDIVLLDSGSSDDTLTIARQFPNARIFNTAFKGFGPLHNEAAALARHDWILSLDSDEILTPELRSEIAALGLDRETVYSVPRQNYYNGRWIRWCGWHPDRQLRLYHRGHTRFTDAQVHESVITSRSRVVQLQHPIRHYSYDSTADFLNKMQHYSGLFAAQERGRTESSLAKAIAHGAGAFFKSYLLKRGFLGGREGLEISVYNANVAFYKYMKLLEANRRGSAGLGGGGGGETQPREPRTKS